MNLENKHYYIFKVKCEECKKPFIFRLELYVFIEPEWLIQSVPIKNICERCKLKKLVKDLVERITNKNKLSG
jgi:hypothetical protein